MTGAQDWSGRLLVATPVIGEGPFDRAVVQLLQHSEDDGALGVVVSAPGEVPVHRVLDGRWGPLAAEPDVVFDGGPVSQTSALCLGRLRDGAADDGTDGTSVVDGAPWLTGVDIDEDPSEAVSAVRVFLGYAGWSAGQLEAEVDEGAWWVVEALPDDCFDRDPATLWRRVVRRQGPPVALHEHLPRDVTLN